MDQLLIALDVDSGAEALALADRLRGAAGGFKIGSRLFTAEGPGIVRALVDRGDRVFLDLKFHDIPQTVAGAVAAATRLGVWMVNVHAAGGAGMMRAAADAAAQPGGRRPLVVAVTMLTSLRPADLTAIGLARGMLEQVEKLARLAQAAGLDGVVASPQEIGSVRAACGPGFTIVTPGIRGGSAAGPAVDDQARVLGPGAAVAAGADFVVVGRPIVAAADPRAAAERIGEELSGVRPGSDQGQTPI